MSVLTTCIKAHLLGKKIIFFGAGQYSISLMPLIYDKIAYFVDNMPSKQGTLYWGIKVYGPEKMMEEIKKDVVIIINAEYYQEISRQCFDLGFRNIYSGNYKNGNEVIPESNQLTDNFLKRRFEHIINEYGNDICRDNKRFYEDERSKEVFENIMEFYKMGNFDFSSIYERGIYFNDIFKFSSEEVYIDCGAYDGRSIVDFIFKVSGQYKKIYAFEPDIANYTMCRRNLNDIQNMSLLNNGLSNCEGDFWFDNRGSQSSKIIENCSSTQENNLVKIHTLKLDSVIKEPPTFIKMDIEGAEGSAIEGAAEIISQYKPKLAISVYHNDDDLIQIPALLRKLVPEYKFYLRHHTKAYVDTVLYAQT